MRVMGALLVVLAGLTGGLLAAGELRKTERERAVLCQMLENMKFELEQFRTPLPLLFSALGEQLSGSAAGLCRALGETLSAVSDEPFSSVWRKKIASLPAPEREVLSPLGSVLGRYSAAEQIQAIETCWNRMEQLAAAAGEDVRTKTRVYIGLSACGGLMLAVLFL